MVESALILSDPRCVGEKSINKVVFSLFHTKMAAILNIKLAGLLAIHNSLLFLLFGLFWIENNSAIQNSTFLLDIQT